MTVEQKEISLGVCAGGSWTQKHRGVAYDFYTGVARNKDSSLFCIRYHMTRSSSYSINAYSDATCLALAKSWVSRMQYWYDIYVAHGSHGGYVFTTADRTGFKEDPQVEAIYACGNKACRQRIDKLRRVAPRSP